MKYFKAVQRFVKSIWYRKTLKDAIEITDGKITSVDGLTPEVQIAVAIARERAPMVAKYAQLQKHTGGLLQKSMVAAYNQALTDMIVLLTRETGMIAQLKKFWPGNKRTKVAKKA